APVRPVSGIARRTGGSGPASSRVARVTPAAIDSTRASVFSDGRHCSSAAPTSPGFTATTTTSLSATAHAGLGTTRTPRNRSSTNRRRSGSTSATARASTSQPAASIPASNASPTRRAPNRASCITTIPPALRSPSQAPALRRRSSNRRPPPRVTVARPGPRNLRVRLALPRTRPTVPHLGPGRSHRTLSRRLAQDVQISDRLRLRGKPAPERDGHDGLEPRLDGLVDHADDAVQLGDAQVLEGHPTDEIEVAVRPDREARAVHRVIAAQQVPVELEMVRRWVGKEVHLVAQRPLVQVEVDRRGVAPVHPEPDGPPGEVA